MAEQAHGKSPGTRRRTFALLLALSLVLPLSLQAQAPRTPEALAERIDAVLDDPAFADAFWGVLVVDAETRETLYARNARKRFIPASTQKLLTTAAALALLGTDFRYVTRLYLGGPVVAGTLQGDLVLRGAGDPSFGSARFDHAQDDGSRSGPSLAVLDAWADSLRALGIRRIAGDVVGDDDVFDDVPYGLGWAWDDLTYAYGAETSGLTFNEGAFALTVRGTRPTAPAAVAWEPLMTDYVAVENRSRTRPAGAAVEEGYARALSGNRFTVTTEVPVGGSDAEALAVHDPTRYAAHTLRLVLLRRGIAVEGAAVDADDRPSKPDYALLVQAASHASPPLSALVRETNRTSNNLYAEHLLRTLGSGPPREAVEPGSVEAGVHALAGFLAEAGIEPAALHLVDGSGLSFMNRLTPEALVRLLAFVERSAAPEVREAFAASLPVGGESGTLARRFRTGAARGNVRAKTGFVTGARTLAGYVTTASGRRVAFALLCNDYSAPTGRVNEAQDGVVEWIARYGG